MVQPHETDAQKVLDFYEDPNTQAEAVHYISYIRKYEKDNDRDFLVKANAIAESMLTKMPYDEVNLDGQPTTSANDIMLVTCLYLSEIGLIPSYED
jgi:hypothetical protein